MLAYVYGVVPISLCRGGGCGVSRDKGRGVRIDFDEDDGPITGSGCFQSPSFRLGDLRVFVDDLKVDSSDIGSKRVLVGYCERPNHRMSGSQGVH